MNLVFEYPVIFADDSTEDVLFEVEISRSGYEHEFGNEIYPEIQDITFEADGLTKENAEFIRRHVLDSDDFNEQIWAQYDKIT